MAKTGAEKQFPDNSKTTRRRSIRRRDVETEKSICSNSKARCSKNLNLVSMLLNVAEEPMETDSQFTPNHFNLLPNEMLLKIFSNMGQIELLNASKVCERFKQIIAKNKRFWKTFALTNACLTPEDFEVLIQFPIRELELTSSRIYPIDGGHGKIRMHPQKVRLFNVDPRSCKLVLKKCKPKHLTLEGTEVHPSLLNFVTGNKRLEVLSMRSVFYYQCCGYFSHRIFKTCVKLKELDLGHGHLTSAQFLWLCERLPKSVERFIWHHMDFGDSQNRDNLSPFVETIVTRLKNLKLMGVSLERLRRPEDVDWLAKLEFLDTLLLCHCDWEDAKLDLFNILQKLRKVKTVQFRIKGELPATKRQEMDEFKRLSREMYDIDINVQWLQDSKCERAVV